MNKTMKARRAVEATLGTSRYQYDLEGLTEHLVAHRWPLTERNIWFVASYYWHDPSTPHALLGGYLAEISPRVG